MSRGPRRPAPIRFRHAAVPELVSCIVPVFNGEPYVGEAVDSILAQTHRDREVIVVDDGSTDGTGAVLDAFGARLRVIRQQNHGASVARNHGLQESRGGLVAFLDADDVWVEDKLEAQVARFRDRPDLELCTGHVRSFWIPELGDEGRRLADHPYHRERAAFLPSLIMARRTLFDRVGGFDPELRHEPQLRTHEDTDWCMRVLASGAVCETLPRLLLHRRQHAGNLTRHGRPTRDDTLTLLKRFLDREREHFAKAGND